MSPHPTGSYASVWAQSIPTTSRQKYHGKTILLIDERTMSQAEHTGLFFKAANNTTFVGSPTAGTNGESSRVLLPGGITASFTRVDVRHADGRQLQRVGLIPDIAVKPTIAGIRAARDEVLERTLLHLRDSKR
jgi:C-terminal processing protease CtpA/Prc